MKTFLALVSWAHEEQGGNGIVVRAEDKQRAYQLILATAEQHKVDAGEESTLSQEHILEIQEMEDDCCYFFEDGCKWGTILEVNKDGTTTYPPVEE